MAPRDVTQASQIKRRNEHFVELLLGLPGKGVPSVKFSSQRLKAAAKLEGSVTSRSEPFCSGWHAAPGIHTAWEQTVSCDNGAVTQCAGSQQPLGQIGVNRHHSVLLPVSSTGSAPLHRSPASSQKWSCCQGCPVTCARCLSAHRW